MHCSQLLVCRTAVCVSGALLLGLSSIAGAGEDSKPNQRAPASQRIDSSVTAKPDLTGRKRLGQASFYADRFAGRKMADGKAMDPRGSNAASRTLPLGTTARVTNLKTGQSAVVIIQDRGPYVEGRIVDLSPSTARQIGITAHQGIATVAVVPIAVPLPNGGLKLGEAASEYRNQ
jgi:rare lipoprotein A